MTAITIDPAPYRIRLAAGQAAIWCELCDERLFPVPWDSAQSDQKLEAVLLRLAQHSRIWHA